MSSRIPSFVPTWTTQQLASLSWLATPAALAERLSEGRWTRAPHLTLLARKVAGAAFGECRRLLVLIPPRHGKSELVSHWTPVWLLELFPEWPIILASYEADFAASWGRKVRDTIALHRDTLSVQISEDSSAAHRWNTPQGGGMITAGVGGPITGRGARLLIIDDPFKNWEEAQSATRREKVWEWFRSTAYTRLEPGGSIVIVMGRWHEDDLVGKLLKEQAAGGETYEVVELPAQARENDPLGRPIGAPLWPERYDTPALEGIRRAILDYFYQALYQQQPPSAAGKLFGSAVLAAAHEGAVGFGPARWRCTVGCREHDQPKPVRGPTSCLLCRRPLKPRDYLSAWDLARKRDWMVGITVDRTELPAQIVAFERFQRVPWPEAARRIEARAGAYPGPTFLDSTGIGDPVMQFTQVPVTGILFTGTSKMNMVQAVMLLLENGELRGPASGPVSGPGDISQLWRELSEYEWDDERLVQDCVMTLAMIAEKLVRGVPRVWTL